VDESYRVVVDEAPSPDDVALLEDRFVEAVARAGDFSDPEEFAVFVRGSDDHVVGGVAATVFGGYCELFALWVDPGHRGRGLGRALISAAEEEARSRGCGSMLFVAYDLLTPGMYEHLGYDTVGLVEDCPQGSTARWLRKRLTTARSRSSS
jgi:GNAT superfamily N-acetyltransferase